MTPFGNAYSAVYDYFQASSACQSYMFKDENANDYAAYYTAMYLIQDTYDALYTHRGRGFSASTIAYIEIWGVLQATVIQQDSLEELYRAITGKPIDKSKFCSWEKLRKLRHVCAGHPSKKSRPKSEPVTRTFMGRSFGNKAKLFGEQEGNCNGCRVLSPIRNFTVDHIIPKSKGGTDHLENLQLLCGQCNSAKGTRKQEYLLAKLSAQNIRT